MKNKRPSNLVIRIFFAILLIPIMFIVAGLLYHFSLEDGRGSAELREPGSVLDLWKNYHTARSNS